MVRAIYALTSLLGLAAAAPVAAPEPEPKPDLSDASNKVESGFQKFEHFFDTRDPGLKSWADDVGDSFEHAADEAKNAFTGSKRGFSFESMGQDIKNGAENAVDDAKSAFTG